MNMKSLFSLFSCFSNNNHAGQLLLLLLLLLLLQDTMKKLICLSLLWIDLLRIDAGCRWIRQIVLDPTVVHHFMLPSHIDFSAT